MYYTTQVQMVIDIKPLILKHIFAIYDNEDTNFENPEHKELKSLQGYEIVYHDIDKLHNTNIDYQNLTFTIEGKTCALVNFTDQERNKFYKHTGNCVLPSSIKLCRFVDSRIFEDDINFESKNDFQSMLNDWFNYEHDRQNELMRKLREISTPTPPPPAEVKGFDLRLNKPQLESLHKLLIDEKFLVKCEFKHFQNAFNGLPLIGFEKLEWIDQTQRNHYVSIHTVFQLLDSCKIILKGECNIIAEVREKIKLIFKNDFGNIQTKFNDFKPLNTSRHILIDSIINLKL